MCRSKLAALFLGILIFGSTANASIEQTGSNNSFSFDWKSVYIGTNVDRSFLFLRLPADHAAYKDPTWANGLSGGGQSGYVGWVPLNIAERLHFGLEVSASWQLERDFVLHGEDDNYPSTYYVSVGGPGLSAIGFFDIGRTQFFAKIGGNSVHARKNFRALKRDETKATDIAVTVGIGVAYALTEHLSLRAELQGIASKPPGLEQGTLWGPQASLGMQYRF